MSQGEEEKARLQQSFKQMYEELWVWREEHRQATFDEIAEQVTLRRRVVMAEVVGALARQHGSGQVAEGQLCPECNQGMIYKGEQRREVAHYLEGETALSRGYYHCPRCEAGLFPPG